MNKRTSFAILAALVLTACGSGGGGGGTLPTTPAPIPTAAPSPTASPLAYLNGVATISRYMATVDPAVTKVEGCDMAQGVADPTWLRWILRLPK